MNKENFINFNYFKICQLKLYPIFLVRKKRPLSQETKQELILNLLAQGDPEKEESLKEYWQSLAEFKKEARQEIETYGKRQPNSLASEREEAKELIEDLTEKGIYPILTIPREYWQKIKKQGAGISAKETWIPGEKIIVGSLGVEPYSGHEKDRAVLQVEVETNDLEPRTTGKDLTYSGIVVFRKGFIPLENITQLS